MQSTRICLVENCISIPRCRGLCNRHYKQWLADNTRHKALPLRSQTPAERLWKSVERSEECWIWFGSTDSGGYGQIRVNGRLVKVHRLSWEISKGPISQSVQLDHQCRVKTCVNPDHLLPVTQKVNNENKGLSRNNRSGYRGVTWYPYTKKWVAHVGHNRKKYHVGYFDTAEEANVAVIEMRNKLHTNNLSDRGM